MIKFLLLVLHGILSYVFSVVISILLITSGVFSQVYSVDIWPSFIEYGFTFLAVLCSALTLSLIFSFQKKDTRFVLLASAVLGIALIYNIAFDSVGGIRYIYVMNTTLTLITYLLGTHIFLRSKRI